MYSDKTEHKLVKNNSFPSLTLQLAVASTGGGGGEVDVY